MDSIALSTATSSAVTAAMGMLHLTPEQAWKYLHSGLEVVGFFTLLPLAMAWLTPKAILLADKLFDFAMAVPVLRDIILMFGPQIIAALEAISNALEQLIDSFAHELEKKVKEASDKQQPPPATQPAQPTTQAGTPGTTLP